MSNNLPKKKQRFEQQDIINSAREIEEFEYQLESDADLIKYEFNLIELPFFTKDKKVRENVSRRYIFSENESMLLTPSAKDGVISHKILQEFDEKIFYGILRLAREQKSGKIITDYYSLAKISGVDYHRFLERIKDSVERLSEVDIEFNNLFYDARFRRKVKGKDHFRLLQRARIYKFDDIVDLNSDIDLDESERETCKKYFFKRRMSEILILELANHIYSNMANKGFLAFSHSNLLLIDNSTARKLYVLITKWHGYDLKNVAESNSLIRDCKFIASRIPLSWQTSTNIRDSIDSIESAAEILKSQNLIKDYVLTKTKPLSDSVIEFVFYPSNDVISKYNVLAASQITGQENSRIVRINDEKQATIFDMVPTADVENLFREVPEAERTESVKKLLEKFASKGSDYIKSNILYTNANCPENYPGYLSRALADDFAAIEREKAELKAKQEKEKKEREAAAEAAEKARKEELQRKAAEKYNNMSEEEKVAFHKELRRKPFFDMFLNSLGGDISKAAIFLIASNLEKES